MIRGEACKGERPRNVNSILHCIAGSRAALSGSFCGNGWCSTGIEGYQEWLGLRATELLSPSSNSRDMAWHDNGGNCAETFLGEGRCAFSYTTLHVGARTDRHTYASGERMCVRHFVRHLLQRARMSSVIAMLQIVRHASVLSYSLCACAWASAQADFNDHKALKRSQSE